LQKQTPTQNRDRKIEIENNSDQLRTALHCIGLLDINRRILHEIIPLITLHANLENNTARI